MAKARTGRKGRDFWSRAIARFERSNLSHETFCRRERLNVGTFRSWLYRTREERSKSKPTFVELTKPTSSKMGCTLRMASAEITFSSSPDVNYIAALVDALESSSR